MKICREIENCIYDSEVLREGKGWEKVGEEEDTLNVLVI